MDIEQIKNSIRNIPDFPQPGIQFKDITTLLMDPEIFSECIEIFYDEFKDSGIDVVLATGGTGVTGRDVTPEAFESVYDKSIPGFGELFRMISYQKIGTSTIQSRATAGVRNGTYLFALPGSPNACKDAWDEILIHQLDNRFRPCNFVELMPRLKEVSNTK